MRVNFTPSERDMDTIQSWLHRHKSTHTYTFKHLREDICEGRTRLMVICDTDNPVGFVVYTGGKDLVKGMDSTTAYITIMEISSEYRGQGYGRCLLSSLESYLRLEGYVNIYLNHIGSWSGQKAESFWWHMGYKDCPHLGGKKKTMSPIESKLGRLLTRNKSSVRIPLIKEVGIEDL